jgi:succinate dehydrogenase flavin-adding protein (antitoxin of CptAB toxin-antitoxin module)
MKELDVLLEAFLERHCAALEQGGFPELESLLASEDDVLWAWIQQAPESMPQHFKPLISALRRGA